MNWLFFAQKMPNFEDKEWISAKESFKRWEKSEFIQWWCPALVLRIKVSQKANEIVQRSWGARTQEWGEWRCVLDGVFHWCVTWTSKISKEMHQSISGLLRLIFGANNKWVTCGDYNLEWTVEWGWIWNIHCLACQVCYGHSRRWRRSFSYTTSLD